jgi:hypothetical protein
MGHLTCTPEEDMASGGPNGPKWPKVPKRGQKVVFLDPFLDPFLSPLSQGAQRAILGHLTCTPEEDMASGGPKWPKGPKVPKRGQKQHFLTPFWPPELDFRVMGLPEEDMASQRPGVLRGLKKGSKITLFGLLIWEASEPLPECWIWASQRPGVLRGLKKGSKWPFLDPFLSPLSQGAQRAILGHLTCTPEEDMASGGPKWPKGPKVPKRGPKWPILTPF